MTLLRLLLVLLILFSSFSSSAYAQTTLEQTLVQTYDNFPGLQVPQRLRNEQ